jgi:hypothetical protein
MKGRTMAESAQENTRIWDQLYAAGHRLWYPYDIVVRIARYHLRQDGFPGVLLDHGCGSGNHLEFLTRVGVKCHGTDVSPSALESVRTRFEGAKLPQPGLSLIKIDEPLGPQLPKYDHVLAWGSVHYNRKTKVLEDLATLIDGLPKGGTFIYQASSINDVAAKQSELLEDGSYRIVGEISGQTGAICSYPKDHNELRSWLPNLDIRDVVTVGYTFMSTPVEYFFAYGVKK